MKKIIRSSVFRYAVVGGISYILELSVLLILHRYGRLSVEEATAVAFWVGLIIAFSLQKIFAFKNYEHDIRAITNQTSVYAILVSFNYIFTLIVVGVFPPHWILISRTLALAITTCWNYFFYKRFIFHNNRADFKPFLQKHSKKLLYFYDRLKVLAATPFLISSVVILSSLLLLSVTIFSAYNSSRFLSTSSDAIVDTYLFADGLNRHQIAVVDQHDNLIKFPIFALQGFFHYGYHSLMLVNMGFVLLTVGLWCLLLLKLFGKRFAVLILIGMASILLGGKEFNYQIAESTIRNIEYPLALWFVLIVKDILQGKKLKTPVFLFYLVGCLLYIVLLAGDNFFQYGVSLPLLIALIWYSIQSRTLVKRSVKAFLVVALTTLSALLLKLLVEKSGIILAAKSGDFATKIVTAKALIPSTGIAANQLLSLEGANIFGLPVNFQNLTVFINFGLLVVSMIGFYKIFQKFSNRINRKEEIFEHFVFTVSALCFVTIFVIYVLSGLAAKVGPNGAIINLEADRYLTFLPLLSLIGFVWFLRERFSDLKILLAAIVIIAVLGMPMAYSSINKAYDYDYTTDTVPFRSSLLQISADLQKNNVNEALTGYWYGTALRFWSDNRVRVAPILGCDLDYDFNSRASWYRPQSGIYSALVIDRSGADASFWNGCTDNVLTKIYGPPTKIIYLSHSIQLWIYHYDARTKLAPFPLLPPPN